MKYWFYYLSKTGLWIFFYFCFGLEVSGRQYIPKTGGFILASNHLSYLDPPVVGTACSRRLVFLTQERLFKGVLLGTFLRGIHAVAVLRDEGDMGVIRLAIRLLRSGTPVAIFPEGGRQLSGKLGIAKRGVGLLAAAAQVPIIPMLVTGTFQALPPTSRRLKRTKIRVAFGPPIPYTEHSAFHPEHSGGGARARHEQLAAAVTLQWHRLAAQDNG